jgi:hypothetical protein
MAIGLFVVRATITGEREAAFNKWYNEEHLPQVLRYNGAVSGRRYRKVMGEDRYQYMAIYEFAIEEVLHRFLGQLVVVSTTMASLRDPRFC